MLGTVVGIRRSWWLLPEAQAVSKEAGVGGGYAYNRVSNACAAGEHARPV